ncbi:zinc ribbon domain-containing protein [Nocardia sp. NRRL S-836]|uniref:zinc ribbon domain-containing protein n=1 Tax=Nocardia sp. NRRL S-836 TaxID=1519492 RepID=UPI0012FA84C0|nr:zinc ribbon domain-containing protein [Nocardia sp. NRRL S-836]
MFDAVNATSDQRKGSRDGAEPNTHRYTKRTYLFRSRVVRDCGRRMMGYRHKLRYTYYRCWPTNNNRGRPDKHAGHPRTVYVREEAIMTAVEHAYSEFLFHPGRRTLLTQDIDQAEQQANRQRSDERARLQRHAADLARRQDNLLRQAESAEPDDPFSPSGYVSATTTCRRNDVSFSTKSSNSTPRTSHRPDDRTRPTWICWTHSPTWRSTCAGHRRTCNDACTS